MRGVPLASRALSASLSALGRDLFARGMPSSSSTRPPRIERLIVGCGGATQAVRHTPRQSCPSHAPTLVAASSLPLAGIRFQATNLTLNAPFPNTSPCALGDQYSGLPPPPPFPFPFFPPQELLKT